MKKTVLFIAVILACKSLFAQATSGDEAKKGSVVLTHNAQSASLFVRYYYDAANINQLQRQQNAWQQVVAIESKEADYWLNYYMVTRLYQLQTNKGAITPAGQKQLTEIARKMDTAVTNGFADSYEKSVVGYFEEEDYTKAITFLKNAEHLNAESKLLLPELVLYYNYINTPEERNRIATKIPEISPQTGIRKYSEELVKTLPDSSIVITNGDFDTYALWLTASALKKQVTVISLKMLENKEYKQKICLNEGLRTTATQEKLKTFLANNQNKKLYVSLTVDAAQVKELAPLLYNTGFCYQYSTQKIDNISALYKNLVAHIPFETLPPAGNEVLKNLLPGYIALYRFYKDTDPTKAQQAMDSAKNLAQQMGFWKQYQSYFK